ncbi:ku domain protein [hydrocarbon metagenome]|uniref:Ku domain protein n=1 Tax=hydrocarbon metagenome TaxID=938273 RepID=A0A0W8E7E9_9ZZZZ
MSPVKYRKYCPNCDRELSSEEIVRGYEYQKDQYVIVNDEDMERIPLENTKTIDILDFVDLAQLDPIYFDKTYYLEASQGGEKAYTLLIHAMEQTGKVAVAKVLIRTKQTLAALRIKEKVLVMETIFYPDEIRSPASLNLGIDSVNLHDNEIKMAVNLIQNLSTDFDPSKYQDQYRQALWEMIEAKVAGKQIVSSPVSDVKGNVVDLMEALKASVELSESKRKATGDKKPGRRKKTGT